MTIQLKVGEIRDLAEEWLQKYFDHLSRGTAADGAKIIVHKSPPILNCQICSYSFQVAVDQLNDSLCPVCGSSSLILLSGREFVVEEIGVIR